MAMLVAGLRNKGYRLALDRGYSSPRLFEHLARQGVGAVGTVMHTRKGFPKDLVKKKNRCVRGEWDWLRNQGNLLAVRWCDKAPIYFLSNYHYPIDAEVTRRDKQGVASQYPATTVVVDYNAHMNAVDKLDQNTILDKRRKQYKWYMRLVLKVFEWCIYNAFILEQSDRQARGETGAGRRKRDMLSFRQELGMALVADFPAQAKKRKMSAVASNEERFSAEIDHTPVVGEGKDHTCVVCFERHKRFKKRYPDMNYKENPMKAVKSTFKCLACQKYLCIKKNSTCWASYHSKVEYWRPMPWEDAALVQAGEESD